MKRLWFMKLLIAAMAGFAFASLLLVTLLAAEGQDPSHTTAVTASGWMVPLLAGGLTGLVSWMLLRGTDRKHEDTCTWRTTGVLCPECGGVIRADWRLCPHCGHRISRS